MIKLVNTPKPCLGLFRNVIGAGRSLASLRSSAHQSMSCYTNRKENGHSFPFDIDLTCYAMALVLLGIIYAKYVPETQARAAVIESRTMP